MSSYFSLPSFARARKNNEDLQKTNPQNPVLKDDDEQFLNKQIESGEAAPELRDVPPSVVTESGEEKEASSAEPEKIDGSADQVVIPEEKPESGEAADEVKVEGTTDQAAEETMERPTKGPAGTSTEEATETPTAETTSASAEDSGATSKTEDKIEEGAQATSEQPTSTLDHATGETPEPKEASTETAEDPPEQVPQDDSKSAEASVAKARKPKRNKSFELPSQEEAEAATKGFNASQPPTDGKQAGEQGEKRTWASYIPTLRSGGKKDADGKDQPSDDKAGDDKSAETAEAPKDGQPDNQAPQRTWAEYASSAYQTLPSMPSLPSLSTSKDSNPEPVYNEDGTVNEAATKEKQEREVSVLLDRLNLSSINNRVFAFSGETEKIYERFAQVLRDTMNGAPTAYEDMDKLMRDAGPQLEKQFKSMPPFVQTLVKSLPAKLGTTLGPELLAAASEKPGADMQARMAAASKPGAGVDSSLKTADTAGKSEGSEEAKKKKRRIPGLKGLVSEQGAVAGILRNVVSFLKVRFPFLASMTNVVMSLAVFILMFVFWYCHKRGKEVRLAREGEAGKRGEEIVEGDDGEGEFEVDITDEEAMGEEADEEEKGIDEEIGGEKGDEAGGEEEKAEEPAEAQEEEKADAPSEAKGEKETDASDADLTAEKSVGVGA